MIVGNVNIRNKVSFLDVYLNETFSPECQMKLDVIYKTSEKVMQNIFRLNEMLLKQPLTWKRSKSPCIYVCYN